MFQQINLPFLNTSETVHTNLKARWYTTVQNHYPWRTTFIAWRNDSEHHIRQITDSLVNMRHHIVQHKALIILDMWAVVGFQWLHSYTSTPYLHAHTYIHVRRSAPYGTRPIASLQYTVSPRRNKTATMNDSQPLTAEQHMRRHRGSSVVISLPP